MSDLKDKTHTEAAYPPHPLLLLDPLQLLLEPLDRLFVLELLERVLDDKLEVVAGALIVCGGNFVCGGGQEGQGIE